MIERAPLRTLVFTTLFPNSVSPEHGIFVAQRLRHLVDSGEVESRVVAPVPWFPFQSTAFGSYARFARIPRKEQSAGFPVQHPRYIVVPKVGMYATPLALARGAWPTIVRLRSEGFDFKLIDAHYYYPDGVAAVLLGRWARVPVVVTARGSDINTIAGHTLARRMIRWACSRASASIAVCEALKREMAGLGADPGRIAVLRNGVDLVMFKPLDWVAARAELGWHGKVLLVVGRLVEGKGHAIAIDAIRSLPDEYKLVVVGDGPLRRELAARADRAGIASRVDFMGALPQSMLPRLYAAADALLLPSDREGMPNVLLESLACGTPVVAADTGGTPEVVSGPDAGMLVQDRSGDGFADACRRLFSQYPDRQRVRAHAERFGWDATTQGQIRLFRGIVEATQ